MGLNQSPINVEKTMHSPELRRLRFLYRETVVKVSSVNGVVPTVRPAPGSRLRALAQDWLLDEIHFKSPAEHSFGGLDYDAEAQLIHSAPSGSRLIVSVFFQAGGAHNEVERLISSLAKRKLDPQRFIRIFRRL